jgi:hypothetical protein
LLYLALYLRFADRNYQAAALTLERAVFSDVGDDDDADLLELRTAFLYLAICNRRLGDDAALQLSLQGLRRVGERLEANPIYLRCQSLRGVNATKEESPTSTRAEVIRNGVAGSNRESNTRESRTR